jgi:hypothetical protein
MGISGQKATVLRTNLKALVIIEARKPILKMPQALVEIVLIAV